MDRITRLEMQIIAMDKRNEKAKRKRTLTALGVIAAAIYIILFWNGELKSPIEYLLGVPASIIAAGMYFYISLLIFTPIFTAAQEENRALERLEIELQRLRNEEMENKKTEM